MLYFILFGKLSYVYRFSWMCCEVFATESLFSLLFRKKDSLKVHQSRVHHLDEDGKLIETLDFSCNSCSRSFGTVLELRVLFSFEIISAGFQILLTRGVK